MKKFALTIFFTLLASPAWATTYYVAPPSAGGNDSNNGLSASAPWLTPNHPVNCGDVILAAPSTSYSSADFIGSWGSVTCSSGNNVAWLKCATFDACKISAAGGSDAMNISASYWGVSGWEVTSSGNGCFAVAPPTSSASVHHVIYANDIANGCAIGAFSGYNNGNSGVDYIAYVGNIAWNGSQGSAECTSGFNFFEPVETDSLPGTHIYIAGNFAWDNFEPNPCSGGTPTDGEGIMLDTLSGCQSGYATPYLGQVVVQNNISVFNGGRGIEIGGSCANTPGSSSSAPVYFRYNTIYGNNADTNQAGANCGEMMMYAVQNVQWNYNIVATNAATGCGSSAVYALSVNFGDSSDQVYNNWAYSAGGSNEVIVSSEGFSFSSNNTLGTNPNFSNPVKPGAPSCSNSTSVANCMATVITNFTPNASSAASYGYQIPSKVQTFDPLFPQWLCNVNLPAGLVTMGCLSASSLPAPVTKTSVTVK